MKKRFAIFAIALVLTSLNSLPTSASRGGSEDKLNPFTVGFTYVDDGVPRICSGTLLTPTIVVTAGHCVVNSKGNFGTDYQFAAPGTAIDAPINPAIVQPKISQVITPSHLKVTEGSELDDVAFIVLDQPLKALGFIRVASVDIVKSVVETSTVNGYGYGWVYETGKPYSSFVRKFPLSWKNVRQIPESLGTIEITSTLAVACRGDSGGSITYTAPDGNLYLLGFVSGAANLVNSCGTKGPDGLYKMRATILYPYLGLISDIYNPMSLKPLPWPSPSPTKTLKKITIKCIKGKVVKKITAINPKCPKGYKKV